MENVSDRIAAVVARCQARAEDPDFQRRAAELLDADERARALMAEINRNHARLRSCVPVGLWRALDAPRVTQATEAVKAHLAAPDACVFLTLSGARGQGKTFAACLAVYTSGRFVDAHDLVRLSAFDPDWGDLEREPVLAIDELGAEFINDSYRANLYALLNRRYADQRKTILVTNLDADGFRARYCPDAEDRLLERLVTGGRWVALSGRSMRTHWSEAGA